MKEYKCANCGLVFKSEWSDEEADKEAELAFGKPVDEWTSGKAVVCDDCYQKMLPANHPDLVDKAIGQN